MRRYTSSAHYHGVVDAGWQHHLLKTEVYDESSLNTDELTVGKRQAIGDTVSVSGHVGYLTHAKRHYFGDLMVRATLPGAVTAALGVERRPLFRTVPLVEPSRGLLQDQYFAEVGWLERVTFRSSQLKDDGAAPFERYELALRQPVSEALALLGQLGYEARSKPSPEYETYRRTQRLAVGAALARNMADQWDLGSELLYALLLRQPHGEETYLRHSAVELRAEVGSRIDENLRLAGRAAFAAEQTDRPSSKVEQRLSVMALVELLR